MIQAKGISVSFKGKQVLGNINLDVPCNERLAVIGDNGSGKTTLALLLAGVIPEFVEAKVEGIFRAGHAGLVMQNPGPQFFAMTVREELGEAAAARRFNASHLLERNVFELSEGEKQKINLVANICQGGEGLLLDEPLELLDPQEARRFLSVLQKIRDKAIVWFDKSPVFVPKMKKFSLGRSKKVALPEKRHSVKKEVALEAGFSLERGGFSLKSASFDLRVGEKIGLIGPNGSGKTMLLKALAGIVPIAGKLQPRKAVSFVPQNPSHLFFQETAAAELVEERNAHRLGIGGILHSNPTTLSRGMQKMLSIATIAPKTIALLDEPTTWLDAGNKAAVYRFINGSDEPMVIATHDRQLLQYCDRVFLIEKGVMRECSSTAANRFFRG